MPKSYLLQMLDEAAAKGQATQSGSARTQGGTANRAPGAKIAAASDAARKKEDEEEEKRRQAALSAALSSAALPYSMRQAQSSAQEQTRNAASLAVPYSMRQAQSSALTPQQPASGTWQPRKAPGMQMAEARAAGSTKITTDARPTAPGQARMQESERSLTQAAAQTWAAEQRLTTAEDAVVSAEQKLTTPYTQIQQAKQAEDLAGTVMRRLMAAGDLEAAAYARQDMIDSHDYAASKWEASADDRAALQEAYKDREDAYRQYAFASANQDQAYAGYMDAAEEQKQYDIDFGVWYANIGTPEQYQQQINELEAERAGLSGDTLNEYLELGGAEALDPDEAEAARQEALQARTGTGGRAQEIDEELEQLRELQGYAYLKLMDRSDFLLGSRYVSTASGEKSYIRDEKGAPLYTDFGFADPLYDYINGNEEARQRIDIQESSTREYLLGYDSSYLKEMTPQEVAILNYLYDPSLPLTDRAGNDTGIDSAARRYLDYITHTKGGLTYRQRTRTQEELRSFAGEHKALGMAASVALAPVKGLSAVGQLLDYADDGRIDQNAAYNKWSYMQSGLREGVTQDMGRWGRFFAQTAMSMSDFVLTAAVSCGSEPLSLILMGTGAMADATIAAKDRGLSDKQSITLGVVAGLAEIITEKVSIDRLLDTIDFGSDAIRNELWYLFKNRLAEGTEEVGSDIINLVADILVSKDKSEWKKSEEETGSFSGAFVKQMEEIGFDFLGGWLSGAGMSNVMLGMNISANRAGIRELGSTFADMGSEAVQSLIDTGLESDRSTKSYQLASRAADRLQAGKELTNLDIGRLYQANVEAVNAEEQAADTGNGDPQTVSTEAAPAEETSTETISGGEGAPTATGGTYQGTGSETLDRVLRAAQTDIMTDEMARSILQDPQAYAALSSMTEADLTKARNGEEQRAVIRDAVMRIVAERQNNAAPGTGTAQNGVMSGTEADGRAVEDAGPYTETEGASPFPTTAEAETNGRNTGDNVSSSGAGILNTEGAGYNGRTGDQAAVGQSGQLSDGGRGRLSGESAGGQGGELAAGAEGQGQRAAEQVRAARRRAAAARDLRLEGVSAQVYVPEAAAGATMTIMPETAWDEEMREVDQEIYAMTGQRVQFFIGALPVSRNGVSANVRGIRNANGIFVQADNLGATVRQIAMHEAFHETASRDGGLVQTLEEEIREKFGDAEFEQVLQTYVQKLRGVIDIPEGASEAEIERALSKLKEEIFADAYGGINAFGAQAGRYQQDTVRTTMRRASQLPQQMSRQNAAATDRTNGPGEESRFSSEENLRFTQEEVETIQQIGRKSVNNFSTDELEITKGFAKRYWKILGVKSPFFRAWFGDWRAMEQTPYSAVPVNNNNAYKAGKTVNADTEITISWGHDLKSETFRHGERDIAYQIIGDIKKVIENAILLDTFTSSRSSKSKMPGTAFMHSFYSVVNTGTEIALVKLYAEEAVSKDGSPFIRAYELKDIKKVATLHNSVLSQKGGLTDKSVTTIKTISDLFAAVKKYDPDFNPNPSSKIVDEDGRPLLVYHGTDADFTVFDRSKGRSTMDIQGSFFSPWEIDAGGYGSNVRAYYLNIKNPAPEGVAYRALNRFKGQNQAGVKAREYLQSLGYDGVDNSGEEYIAFESEQIKSATDNIGTFDPANPDSLFSVDETVESADESGERWDAEVPRAELPGPEQFRSTDEAAEIGVEDDLFSGGSNAYRQQQAQRESDAVQELQTNRETAREEREARLDRQRKEIRRQVAMQQQARAERRKTQQETKKPVAPSVAKSSKADFRRQMLGLFSIPEGSRQSMGRIVDEFADQVIRNGRVQEADRQQLFDRLYDSGVIEVKADEFYRTVRGELAGRRFYVNEQIRTELGDDWNAMRKRAFAAGIWLTNDANDIGVDIAWAELGYIMPGVFDPQETDLTEMLNTMIQMAEEGKTQHLSLAEYAEQMAGREGVSEDEMIDSIEREMDQAIRTLAEKARLELQLRERTGIKIAEERTKADERVLREKERGLIREADARARGQEQTRRIREEYAIREAREKARRQEQTQRARQNRELREMQKKTLKALQWLSKNQFRAPEELRRQFQDVLNDIDIYAVSAANEMNWSNKYQATWRDLADMYKQARESDPNFLPSKELEKIVSRLDDRKVGEMDLAALQDLYKAAVGLQTELQTRNKVIGDELERSMSEAYDSIKGEITRPGRGYSKGARGMIDKIANGWQLTPMNTLLRMAGWDKSGTWASFARQLEEGERDARHFETRAKGILADFLSEHEEWAAKADGQGKDAVWYEVRVPELLELGMGDKPIFGETVTVYMTPAQKVHMYLESKNYDNLRHMAGGRTFADKELYSQGLRTEAFAQGRTIKLAPETVKQLVSDLTPEEAALASALERYYNDFSTAEINRVSNALYGYDKAIGKNYAPIYTNENYVNSVPGIYDATAEGVGNLKQRQYSKNPSYNIGAFDAFEKSVDRTARFVGMAIPARNWNTLMNWRETNNSMGDVITHKWGEEAKDYINDLIVELQGDRRKESGKIESFTNSILSKYISGVFGFNPSIVFKQFASFPLAGSYLGFQYMPKWIPGAAQVDTELIGKYTGELDYRLLGYATPETAVLKDNPGILERNGPLNFLFGGGSITWMDGFTVRTLWTWAENRVRAEQPELQLGTQEQIDAGQSEFYKAVAETFEEAVSRSQPMYDTMHRSNIMRESSPITRAFTLFKTVPQQEYNMLREAFGEAQWARRNGTAAEQRTANRKVGRAVLGIAAGNLMIGAITFLNALFKHKDKRYRDDDDELTVESVMTQFGKQYFADSVGLMIGGDVLADVIGAIAGDRWYGIETPGITQMESLIEQLIKAGQTVGTLVTDSLEILRDGGDWGQYMADRSGVYLSAVEDVAGTLGTYLAGLPVDNVRAYLLGALQWISPAMREKYDALFEETSKASLKGLSGTALEAGVEDLMRDRVGSASEETIEALAGLYAAGYTDAIPAAQQKTVSVNGEDRELGLVQQQLYKNAWSGIVGDQLDALTASDAFQEADEETQAKILRALYDYATAKAKEQLFEDFDGKTDKADAVLDAGGSLAEWALWSGLSSTADKDAERYGILSEAELSDDVKVAIAGNLMGTEMETESGSKSQYAKMLEALDNGLSMDDYSQWRSLSAGLKTAEQYATLEELPLSEQAKVAVAGLVMGTEMETESGAKSQYAKMLEALDNGLSMDEYCRWRSLSADMKTAEQYAALEELPLSEKAKVAVAGLIMGTEMETASGGKSAYAKMQDVLGTGLGMDQYLAARTQYYEIDERDLKASEKATEFAYWVDSQGWKDSQADAVRTALTYSTYIPVDEVSYDKVKGTGISAESAYAVDQAVKDLEPLEGQSGVKSFQQWRAVVDATGGQQEQARALAAYMTEGQQYELSYCVDAGISPETYVHVAEMIFEADKGNDANGSYNAKEVEDAIRYVSGSGWSYITLPGNGIVQLTDQQKAILWQCFAPTTSAKNNPWGRAYGQAYLDAKAGA